MYHGLRELLRNPDCYVNNSSIRHLQYHARKPFSLSEPNDIEWGSLEGRCCCTLSNLLHVELFTCV